METYGAVQIFSRSLAERGLRFTKYLGDGDSKGFKKVLEQKPYGSKIQIHKIECINHVGKRMGRRLRKLPNIQVGSGKDKRKLKGKGGLTDKVITKLQSYYSKAIRDNIGDLKKMKEAVWSTYLHHSDPDKKNAHKFCPSNSWCYYKNSSIEKKLLLSPVCMRHIKPIYDDLASEDLLRRCVDGLTQNVNEGFNAQIWRRYPKSKFAGLNTLRIAVYDAIVCWNEGYSGRKAVFEKVGLQPGKNTENGLKIMDEKKEKNRRARVNRSRSRRSNDPGPNYGGDTD